MAKRKIYLDEISVDYGDINSNPYFNQQNYVKVEEPKKKVNNSYKPSKTAINSVVVRDNKFQFVRNSNVGPGEYAVKKGDSLWKIAQEHGTTVQALRDANPEIKGNMIYPNQIINVGNKSTNTSNSSTATQQTPANKTTTTKQTNETSTKKK